MLMKRSKMGIFSNQGDITLWLIGRPRQVFELIWSFIPSLLIYNLIKAEGLMLMTSQNRHLQQSRGHNSLTDRSTSLVFTLIWAFIPNQLICTFQKWRSNADGKVKKRRFQQWSGHNSIINGSNWPTFKNIQAFIPNLLVESFTKI